VIMGGCKSRSQTRSEMQYYVWVSQILLVEIKLTEERRGRRFRVLEQSAIRRQGTASTCTVHDQRCKDGYHSEITWRRMRKYRPL
jgi:hypothetical protein